MDVYQDILFTNRDRKKEKNVDRVIIKGEGQTQMPGNLPPEPEKPKKSFNQLMETLRQAEDDLINLTNEEMAEIFGDLKSKVDGVYNWESKLKFDIIRVSEDIKKLTERKRTLEGSLKRFRDYMVFVLESNDTPMLKGEMWDIKLRKRDRDWETLIISNLSLLSQL